MTSKKTTDKPANDTAADMSGNAPEPVTPDQPKTLYAPDGRKWEASSPEEVVNLKALGYTDAKPKASAAADEPAAAE